MQFNHVLEEKPKPKQPYGQVRLLLNINKKLDGVLDRLEEQRLVVEHLRREMGRLKGQQQERLNSQTLEGSPRCPPRFVVRQLQ